MNNEIKVTSHVGRDVLQTSAFFNSVALVVWEYLINGIEYRHSEDQRKPSVYVSLNKKKKMIQITDNGIIPIKERVVDRFYDPVMWIYQKLFGNGRAKQK